MHTPGPWRANLHHTQEYSGRTHGFIHGPNTAVPLAAVVLGVEGMSQDEGRANAYLLAAAPELYQALETLLTANHGQIARTFADEATIAHKALAKARGEI